MDRTEALAFLKIVQCCCETFNPTKISLDESQVTDSSVGYRIIIEGPIDREHRNFIELSATPRSLVVKEEPDRLVIYKQR